MIHTIVVNKFGIPVRAIPFPDPSDPSEYLYMVEQLYAQMMGWA